jgi:hypothetical protein
VKNCDELVRLAALTRKTDLSDEDTSNLERGLAQLNAADMVLVNFRGEAARRKTVRFVGIKRSRSTSARLSTWSSRTVSPVSFSVRRKGNKKSGRPRFFRGFLEKILSFFGFQIKYPALHIGDDIVPAVVLRRQQHQHRARVFDHMVGNCRRQYGGELATWSALTLPANP